MVHESGNGRAGLLPVSDEISGVPGAVVVSTDFKERINNYPQITQISVFRSNADSELKASFVELAVFPTSAAEPGPKRNLRNLRIINSVIWLTPEQRLALSNRLPIGCGIRVDNISFDLEGVLHPTELNLVLGRCPNRFYSGDGFTAQSNQKRTAGFVNHFQELNTFRLKLRD